MGQGTRVVGSYGREVVTQVPHYFLNCSPVNTNRPVLKRMSLVLIIKIVTMVTPATASGRVPRSILA